jgi:molybdopterin molybdotransferase
MSEREYLTVAEALALVLEGVSVLPFETVSLLEALGMVLAQPVVANDTLPPFANSSMDGFAVRAADVLGATVAAPVELTVVADIAAGRVPTRAVGPGETARIMTGAPLPDGADAVVPVEDTSVPWRDQSADLPQTVAIRRAVNPGDSVRYPGEDIRQGDVVMPAGRTLRPQEIGVLAALGVARVSVVRRPRVGVLATGDELVTVEEALTPGTIRNSNSYGLAAHITAAGGEPILVGIARDTEAAVREKLQTGLDQNVDLFISSAGVSVGAYDVVKAVLETAGGMTFWRVRMRPGKPLAYGRYAGVPYLGLPGNPVSALVSFERFARPAVLKMGGHTDLERPRVMVRLVDEIHSDGRESYVRGIVERSGANYRAKVTGAQGSHLMTSLVQANALLIVPEGVRHVPAGEMLEAMMIDWPNVVF